LAGAATAAVLAGSAAVYSLHAYTADPLFSSNANAAARMPSKPAAVPDFAELAAAVKPAVVSVRVKAEAEPQTEGMAEDPNPFEGTPFEKFFRGVPGNDGQNAVPDSQPRHLVQGQGSGFFVSADGYIVTNNHVVNHTTTVEVVTDSGNTLKAKVVGVDPKTDLALIKVEGGNDFPFVKLAQKAPKIGEWVIAMGNPFGLGGTVTAGIVSAQGRDLGSGPYDDYIQIDAPVNHGNSGGPTFNLKGEVIGVNTAIYSPSGGSVGIAFDIPASTIASVIPQLQKDGHVARGWLGVRIQPVTKEIAESVGLKNATGALVSEPQPGSPAAVAGLKSGDVIVGFDVAAVNDPRDLARKIAAAEPNKAVALRILRDGKEQTVNLKLGQLKDQKVRNAAASEDRNDHRLREFGITVAPAASVEGTGEKGLAVVGIDPNGKAAELGFQLGDIILKAGNRPVSSLDDLAAAVSEAKAAGHKHTLVMVERDHVDRFVALPVAAG
jgi:serine protease Do